MANGHPTEDPHRKADGPPSSPTDPTMAEQPTEDLAAAAGPRPSMQKSRTEEPATIDVRSTFAGMGRRATERPTQLGRSWTYKFGSTGDFEDSESSSDSDTSASGEEQEERSRSRRAQSAGGMKQKKRTQKQKGGHHPRNRFLIRNDTMDTMGRVRKRDGRLNITLSETANSGQLAKTLGAGIKHHLLPGHKARDDGDLASEIISLADNVVEHVQSRLKLNIVIIVIGSRGDVQPFLRIAQILKYDYGHRVRIATHPAFRDFVEKESGLEFFSISGNPSKLMAFMVKNPGLIPSLDTIKAGEIGEHRASMYEMFQGMWRACINATDDETDKANMKMMGERSPFIADVIISNPPSFAHIHIAERLGIPLHMMFTFPYTPTGKFPHPLANIKRSNVDSEYTNFMSYPLVELMTWQGLGDLVNKFREKTLGLDPVSTLWAPGQLYRLKVPYTYLWSPGLVPKPPDWGSEIDLAGFVFLSLASSFDPPGELTEFLSSGETPVYIGFGSIVVDDPQRFTTMVFEAVKLAGVRALVSKGWGGLGGGDCPDNIFLLDNTPHDWLFPKVSAVVHHGGAGTTAIGLKCGKPTMIVPFFGDQPFWGAMVAEAKAGAFKCIPYKKLNAEKLAEGIKQCLTDEAKSNAGKIAENIAKEGDGAVNAVRSFHRSLPLKGDRSMRCSILDSRVAVWQLKNTRLRLSALAAELLVAKKKIRWQDLRLVRHCDWNDYEGPGEPITGGGAAVVGSITEASKAMGSIPLKMTRTVKKRAHHHGKKRRIAKQGEKRRTMMTKEASPVEDVEDKASLTAENPGAKTETKDHANETIFKEAAIFKQATSQVSGDTMNGNVVENGKPAEARSEGMRPEHRHVAAVASAKDTTSQADEPGTESHDSLLQSQGTQEKSQILANEEKKQPSYKKKKSRRKVLAREETNISQLSADPEEGIAEELADEAGRGIKSTAATILKSPLDFTMAVAQGFHNAPRLYGDGTVRRPPRVTGFKSGVRAGRDEFVHGVYDGFTGLVRLPARGAREGGVIGGLEGFGMGIGGVVLKNIAAGLGPVAYTMKGIHEEMKRSKQPTGFIRKARIIQGSKELQVLREAQNDDYDGDRPSDAYTAVPPRRGENLREMEMKLDKDWQIVMEVMEHEEKKRDKGVFRGRMALKRQQKKWSRLEAYESVETAKLALQANEEGMDMDEALQEHRKTVGAANKKARKPAVETSNTRKSLNEQLGACNGELSEIEQPRNRRPPADAADVGV